MFEGGKIRDKKIIYYIAFYFIFLLKLCFLKNQSISAPPKCHILFIKIGTLKPFLSNEENEI